MVSHQRKEQVQSLWQERGPVVQEEMGLGG